MPRINSVELLPPEQSAAELVAQVIEQKVAEALAHGSEADFQPFFQPREVAWEIKRRQTVTEKNKYSGAYEDWGCLVCHKKKRPHKSLWMCGSCYEKAHFRLVSSMRKRAPKPNQNQPTFMDSVRLAREALAPSAIQAEGHKGPENRRKQMSRRTKKSAA